MFFRFISVFWMKIEGKSKNYINFSWKFIFFSQNCINCPVSSVSWRIYILSKKDHLYFNSEKKNICNFTKKVSFHRKSSFFDNFLLISLFSSNNKPKTLNIDTIYFFSEKNNKWRVFQRFYEFYRHFKQNHLLQV